MIHRFRSFFTLCILASMFLSSWTVAHAFTVPAATGHIVDTADMLTEDVAFEEQLSKLKAETGIEIAVATIPTLNDEIMLEEAAEKIFNTWGVGSSVNDNGVLLLIVRDDRKFRIEVGYGAEGALTDIQSKQILDGMVDFFRSGDFDEGVRYALGEIVYTVSQDESLRVDPNSSTTASGSENSDGMLDMILFFIFTFGGIAFVWISTYLAKSKSWHEGAWIGGGIGAMGVLLMGFPWFMPIIFAGLGAIWDYLVSQDPPSGGGGSSGWGGGSSSGSSWGGGSSSSSGSSFGGFGGGRSGGGGASGGW